MMLSLWTHGRAGSSEDKHCLEYSKTSTWDELLHFGYLVTKKVMISILPGGCEESWTLRASLLRVSLAAAL